MGNRTIKRGLNYRQAMSHGTYGPNVRVYIIGVNRCWYTNQKQHLLWAVSWLILLFGNKKRLKVRCWGWHVPACTHYFHCKWISLLETLIDLAAFRPLELCSIKIDGSSVSQASHQHQWIGVREHLLENTGKPHMKNVWIDGFLFQSTKLTHPGGSIYPPVIKHGNMQWKIPYNWSF